MIGPVLEDGREYTEGSKYKKATASDSKVKLVMGEKKLYGLCHLYHDKAMKEKGIDEVATGDNTVVVKEGATNNAHATSATASSMTTGASAISISNPYAPKKSVGSVVSNPYAKKATVKNPYANPYAKAKGATISKSSSAAATHNTGTCSSVDDPKTENSLWVDRHKPVHSREILGNKSNVTKLQNWLRTWEKVFNTTKNMNKTFSNPKGPWKAVLLSGPPGIGSKYLPSYKVVISCFYA